MSPKIILLLLLIVLPLQAKSQIVKIEISQGVEATAEYREGDSDKPALIMMHGFLQTRDFSTVRRLADSLVDSGFSVLAPTLSLGINLREKSLPCEAIQMHSMDDAVNELSLWSEWLIKKGHKQIQLVGHSAGSVVIVGMLSEQKPEAVKGAILISLSYFGQGPASNENDEIKKAAQKDLISAPDKLGKYALAFCKSYVSRPADYLSYYDRDKAQTLNALGKINVPVHIIVGSADQRIDINWVETLGSKGAKIVMVDGANHFFDQAHEFDLLEEVEGILLD